MVRCRTEQRFVEQQDLEVQERDSEGARRSFDKLRTVPR